MPTARLSYSSITSRNQGGGGDKKQGLPRTFGLGSISIKIYQEKTGYCAYVNCPPVERPITTIPPTTQAPTTQAPTTQAPTTQAPTTTTIAPDVCPPPCNGGIFMTQTELETLRGCIEIEGDVHIMNFDGKPDFSVFDSVEEIEGDLNIDSCDELEKISGFNKLKKIRGTLLISSNPKLTTITGFSILTDIIGVGFVNQLYSTSLAPGSFMIMDNDSLQSIINFTALANVGGTFQLGNNEMLSRINMPSLEYIGQDFIIEENNSLVSISNFPTLRGIKGEFNITKNPSLMSIKKFNLGIIHHFFIKDNNMYTNITSITVYRIIGSVDVYASLDAASVESIKTAYNNIPYRSFYVTPVSKPGNPGYVFTSSLSLGMVDDDVKEVQFILNSLGYLSLSSIAFGNFDNATKAAVTEFQIAKGITPVNGIVTGKTFNLLQEIAFTFTYVPDAGAEPDADAGAGADADAGAGAGAVPDANPTITMTFNTKVGNIGVTSTTGGIIQTFRKNFSSTTGLLLPDIVFNYPYPINDKTIPVNDLKYNIFDEGLTHLSIEGDLVTLSRLPLTLTSLSITESNLTDIPDLSYLINLVSIELDFNKFSLTTVNEFINTKLPPGPGTLFITSQGNTTDPTTLAVTATKDGWEIQ